MHTVYRLMTTPMISDDEDDDDLEVVAPCDRHIRIKADDSNVEGEDDLSTLRQTTRSSLCRPKGRR